MIDTSHIFALSQPDFVRTQLRAVLCGKPGDQRRSSLWRGWGFEQP